MKNFFIFLFPVIILIGNCNISYAQKETSFWFFYDGEGLDFNHDPPSVFYHEANDNKYENLGTHISGVADNAGNLLFYTDGRSFWNKKHNIMQNGDGGYTSKSNIQQNLLISPYPGSINKYYVFVSETDESPNAEGLNYIIYYSIVDMSLNEGEGKVILKNNIFQQKAGSALAIAKNNKNGSYWLITSDLFVSKLYAFNITNDGIINTPITSILNYSGGIGNDLSLKFSPDNNYLCLTRFYMPDEILEIYQFDSNKGTFIPELELRVENNVSRKKFPYKLNTFLFYEFSPNSKNLFVIETEIDVKSNVESIFNSSLVKYDLTAPNNKLFRLSGIKIYDFSPSLLGHNLRPMLLSPDLKIAVPHDGSISFIENPNACKNIIFNEKKVKNKFPDQMPQIPSFYFYQNLGQSPLIDAGKDIIICPGDTQQLVSSLNPDYTYEWLLNINLSNSKINNPVYFSPKKINESIDTIQQYLRITDSNGCYGYDSLEIITLPRKVKQIAGRSSVCPGSTNISYWLEGEETNISYEWNITGGDISKNQGMDSILVNWGTASSATIILNSQNIWGCYDSIPDYPVKVFKYLDTEKPKGSDTLKCDSTIYKYFVQESTGSYFDWQINYGTILSGQGTSKVNVKWAADKLFGKLWIDEHVNADLEVCFGQSDTLIIFNPGAYEDEMIALENVSLVSGINDSIKINYRVYYPDYLLDSIFLWSKTHNNWNKLDNVNKYKSEALYYQDNLNYEVNDYQLRTKNMCNVLLNSQILNNILLTGTIDDQNRIILEWNNYRNGEQEMLKYNLYRKIDLEEKYRFHKQTGSNNLILNNIKDGFKHCFQLNASYENGASASWSNEFCLEYPHSIIIPNVITPNGDGKNDFWIIENIELYPQAQVRIFNRYGKLIFNSENGYSNDWDGKSISPGIYFYSVITLRDSKIYTGWITVLL